MDADEEAEGCPAGAGAAEKASMFRIRRKEVSSAKKGKAPGIGQSPVCYTCLSYINAELGLVSHPLLAPRCFCSAECLREAAKHLFVDCERCSKVIPYSAAMGDEHAYCSSFCLETRAEELSFERHEGEADLPSSETDLSSEPEECANGSEELLVALRNGSPPRSL